MGDGDWGMEVGVDLERWMEVWRWKKGSGGSHFGLWGWGGEEMRYVDECMGVYESMTDAIR